MSENEELKKRQQTATVNHAALLMKRYHHGDVDKVQHFVRVYTLAKSIGELEKLSDDDQFGLELAAVVHSVEGGKVAEAKSLLKDCGVSDEIAMHVCHMVLNAENYEHISTLDHQILVEAKLIVDFKEHNTPEKEIIRKAEDIFITNTGKLFLKRAFNL